MSKNKRGNFAFAFYFVCIRKSKPAWLFNCQLKFSHTTLTGGNFIRIRRIYCNRIYKQRRGGTTKSKINSIFFPFLGITCADHFTAIVNSTPLKTKP